MTRLALALAAFAAGIIVGHQLPYRLWLRRQPAEPEQTGTFTEFDGTQWSYTVPATLTPIGYLYPHPPRRSDA